MKAAAYKGPRDIRVLDLEEPTLHQDGVIVKVKACGICGTDMHVYKSGLMVGASTEEIQGHRIIGHEFTGEIAAVGSGVSGFAVGDRVASIHNKAGMAEYTEVRGERLKNLLRIPDHVGFETAATVEPLCNPTHSFHLREPREGEIVAVFGAGVLGLGYLQVVKARSGARTIISDISDRRLEMASRIGSDFVIDAKNTDVLKRIKEITGEHEVRYMEHTAGGCDITVESAGIGTTFAQCLEALKPESGTAIIAAAYEGQFSIEPNMIIFKYMQVLGSMGYTDQEAGEAMDLIGSGLIDRDILISHRLPLAEAPKGFELQADPHASVKVMIVMS